MRQTTDRRAAQPRLDDPRYIVADLKDTPYNLDRRINTDEIVLAYGDGPDAILERWRDYRRGAVSQSSYVIRVNRRGYRFAGLMPAAWAVAHRADVAAFARASRGIR